MHDTWVPTMRLANLVTLLSAAATSARAEVFPQWDYHMCTTESVEADRPLLVKVVQNATVNVDSGWDSVRVMLAKHANYSGAVSGPVCTLIDCMPMDASDFTVIIPASVGPSGSFYDLSWELYYSKDIDIPTQYNHNMSTLGYTNGWNGFTLYNANGTFYPFESSPRRREYNSAWPWGLAIVPCEAYACARVCIDRYYADLSETLADYTQTEDCIKECPNIDDRRNNCPNAGGSTHVPEVDASSVPNGCVKRYPEAFPAAAASASAASVAAASASSATETPSIPSSSSSSSTGGMSRTIMLKAEVLLLSKMFAVATAVLILLVPLS